MHKMEKYTDNSPIGWMITKGEEKKMNQATRRLRACVCVESSQGHDQAFLCFICMAAIPIANRNDLGCGTEDVAKLLIVLSFLFSDMGSGVIDPAYLPR